jgi:hypothetical protein
MSAEPSERKQWDRETIRAALPWCEYLCEQRSVELKRCGGRLIGLCPFHAERTGSFTVFQDGHWHCFGCGEGGDEFALFAAMEGLDLKTQWHEILERMAAIARIPGAPAAAARLKPVRKKRPPPPCIDDTVYDIPPLRRLSVDTMAELAEARGLEFEAVAAAEAAGILRGVELGVSVRRGLVWGDAMWSERDRLRIGPVRCWICTDGMRVAAQARRLDGTKWTRGDGDEFKAWTMGTAKWPLGVCDIGSRPCVALVEGGPDMLAAWQFVMQAGRTGEVAVVGILGASVRMRADSLMRFRGKRVRIFPHRDRLDPRSGKRAGDMGAERWAEQLHAEGVAVDIWPLDAPGIEEEREAWDLNDAAREQGLLYELARAGFSRETGFTETKLEAPPPWPDWMKARN